MGYNSKLGGVKHRYPPLRLPLRPIRLSLRLRTLGTSSGLWLIQGKLLFAQGFGLFRVNTVEGSKISANDGYQRRGFAASVRFSLCFGRLFLFVGWFWLRENGLVELVDAAKLLDWLGVVINTDVTVTVVEAAVSPTLADDE